MDDVSKAKSVKLTQDEPLSKEDFLKVAKDRFKLCLEAEAESRREELDDVKFMVGDQWPLNIKSERQRDMRPCLTINQCPQYVRGITNDQRQNRPAVKVNPADDKASLDTATILQGMVRHIEYASDGDIAIDTAEEWAVKSGLGYFALCTDYASPLSFQQEIKFRQLDDRFAVFTDPYWTKPDGSDMQFGFIVSDPSREEFLTEFPTSELSEMSDWEAMGVNSPNWFTKNTCRIAEYYYKTYEDVEVVLLSDGREVERDDIDKLPEGLADGVREVSKRIAKKPKIKWAKINGVEILEENEILGEYIPIIPVIGEKQVVDNKKVYAGIIRHLKDPQRMYNYFASAETEAIALAPRAPYVGAAGQFEGHEEKWQTANTKNHAFLEYNPQSLNGKDAPPPQRNVAEPAVQAITQAMVQRAQEMKATTGMYDAALGKQSNEIAGVAIQRRIQQSNLATFHFIDNLARSQRHAGRIMLSWIPKIYNTAQAVRIIGDDGEVDFAKINQIFEEGGENKSHFLDQGRYDCTVSTGPSYQTKRQEAVASMLDLARSLPQAMQVGLDLLVRNMDWPGAQEIADRIKKTLPPQLVDDKSQPIPPEAQQQMSHMNQMIQQLIKQNQEYMQIIGTKQVEAQSKEKIEKLKAQTQLQTEWMKHHAKDSQIQFQAENDLIHKSIDQSLPINGAGGLPAATPSMNNGTGPSLPGQTMGGQNG